MGRIDPNFPHDIYQFIHRPLREIDQRDGNRFLERFVNGMQAVFERIQGDIEKIKTLNDPEEIDADLLQYLKDHVGFTRELNSITDGLSDNDLRKLISLAVALWKQKGLEVGYKNIASLFTGRSVRVFNWFDFRWIIGEKQFGNEQLGEDPWLISLPQVEASQDNFNNVVSLLTFESNFKDRSLSRNDAILHGSGLFFDTPSSGFPNNSEKYVYIKNSVITQANSSVYDFSGDFTVEMYVRTDKVNEDVVLFKRQLNSGKGVLIGYDNVNNDIYAVLNDGTNSAVLTVTSTNNLQDGVNRHVALVVDRDNGARLYLNGVESSSLVNMAPFSDLTVSSDIMIGGDFNGSPRLDGDLDNFRLSLNSVYDVTSAILISPLVGFIEYQEEQLDEFYSDIRVVDEGDLNKILMLRILNLMRPVSERLRVLFIDFYDAFVNGKGRFDTIAGLGSVDVQSRMVLNPSTVEVVNVANADTWNNIVWQTKAKDESATGGVYSFLFFYQDVDNFYEFEVSITNKQAGLYKTVAGVKTQIGTIESFDLAPNTDYYFTITTDTNGTDTLLQTFIDGNRIHKEVDSAFTEGRFGYKTDSSTTLKVSETELFQRPLDVRLIEPGFDL